MGRALWQLFCPVPQELEKQQQLHVPWFVKSWVFTYIEMNASDTRSKKTLEEHISQSLNNKTMDGFLTGCQISVRFGMTLILLKILHEFSSLT